MNQTFDYIIIGGGCAGLSLAFYLTLQPETAQKKVLILEKRLDKVPNKTWCFWTRDPSTLPYQCAQQTAWQHISLHAAGQSFRRSIAPYQYVHLDSHDFYQEVHDRLRKFPNIVVKEADVHGLQDAGDRVSAHSTEGTFHASYLFDSRPRKAPSSLEGGPLKQHFLGWFIETEQDAFDASTVTFMDFRAGGDANLQFAYILPFDERHALVEFTVFSQDVWPETAYEAPLRTYIQSHVHDGPFRLYKQERGIIPMTDELFSQRASRRMLYLGTAAGMTKPSTGYTFLNIQRASKGMVRALAEGKDPLVYARSRDRFAFYDGLLLHLMHHRKELFPGVFMRLFGGKQANQVLRFLDERSHLLQEMRLFCRLPWLPFLGALVARHLQHPLGTWWASIKQWTSSPTHQPYMREPK